MDLRRVCLCCLMNWVRPRRVDKTGWGAGARSQPSHRALFVAVACSLAIPLGACQKEVRSGPDMVQVPNIKCREAQTSGPGTAVPLTSPSPEYGGPSNNFRAKGPRPPLSLYWTFSEARRDGMPFHAPVTTGERVFVSGPCLFALNNQGEEHWRFQPQGGASLPARKLRQLRAHGIPVRTYIPLSNPVVVGDEVMVAYVTPDFKVVLQALDAATGQRSWTWSINERGVDALALVARGDELLLIGERRGLLTRHVKGVNLWLVAAGGRLLWSTATRSPAVLATAEHAGPPAAVTTEVAVVPVQNGIEAISMADGERLWAAGADKFFPQTPKGRLFPPTSDWTLAPVAVVGNRALAVAENDSGISWFRAFSLRSGRKLFELKGDSISRGVASFAAAGRRVYLETGFGPRPHHLVVLTPTNFKIARRTPLDTGVESFYGGSVVPMKGGIIALATTGMLPGPTTKDILVHVDRRARMTWHTVIKYRPSSGQLKTDAPVSTGLVPTGGGFLVSTSDGLLHAYGPSR